MDNIALVLGRGEIFRRQHEVIGTDRSVPARQIPLGALNDDDQAAAFTRI
jgi:hypothetical protein